MSLFDIFSSPTVSNDLATAQANVKGIVDGTDNLEVIAANWIKSGIPGLTTSIFDEVTAAYLGAGEVAYSLPGTEQQHIVAAVAGGDTVLSASGNVTPNLIPHGAKCALVCIGMGAKSIGNSTQVNEALILAVQPLLPAA